MKRKSGADSPIADESMHLTPTPYLQSDVLIMTFTPNFSSRLFA